MAEIPLGLYVHLPWCIKKCPYCDFNSYPCNGALPETNYLDALAADLRTSVSPVHQSRPLQSIFFGGGTPSLFAPDSISTIIETARDLFSFDKGIEITLEANPGTIDRGRLRAYGQAGVNRLSIGVQSFDDPTLSRLGRIHSGHAARQAVVEARAAGFDNVNIDLMYGLPHQSWESAKQDLDQAVVLGPEHISWYQLTIEPNTAFHRAPPKLPGEDAIITMADNGAQLLANSGYSRYEVSAYSRNTRESVHNLNYWLYGDYLGIGAGAHGKLTTDNGIFRTIHAQTPQRYLSDPRAETAAVPAADRPLEFMMNVLRLTRGADPALFESRTLLPLEAIEPFLTEAYTLGFLTSPDEIRPTARGLCFLDDVLLLIASG